MKVNNEITLRIKGDMEQFKQSLKEKGYEEKGHFILYDTFMMPEKLEIDKMETREILAKAIIIRKVEDITKNEVRQDIVYKIKKFNEQGEILEQKSIRLKILNCEDAEKFMEAIGYTKLMNIIEKDYVYEKKGFSLATKEVIGGDNMIEVETELRDARYDTVRKLQDKLKQERLPLDFTDCFVKKAEVELNKILSRE